VHSRVISYEIENETVCKCRKNYFRTRLSLWGQRTIYTLPVRVRSVSVSSVQFQYFGFTPFRFICPLSVQCRYYLPVEYTSGFYRFFFTVFDQFPIEFQVWSVYIYIYAMSIYLERERSYDSIWERTIFISISTHIHNIWLSPFKNRTIFQSRV